MQSRIEKSSTPTQKREETCKRIENGILTSVSRQGNRRVGTSQRKAIRNIIQSQEKLQSFARIRQIFKPKSQSGLAHLLIPAETAKGNNEWEMVTHPETIHEMLRQRNIQHFGMAHGTPFTHDPLT
jgi:hypothetical protein